MEGIFITNLSSSVQGVQSSAEVGRGLGVAGCLYFFIVTAMERCWLLVSEGLQDNNPNKVTRHFVSSEALPQPNAVRLLPPPQEVQG